MNAAQIIDAILVPALQVIDDRRRAARNEDIRNNNGLGAGNGGIRVINWETKLIELVNVAIDAWAVSKNVDKAEGWFRFSEQQVSLQDDDECELSLSSLISTSPSTTKVGSILNPRLVGNHVLKLYEESHRWVINAFIRSHEHKYLEKAILLLEDLMAWQQQNTNKTSLLDDTEARLYPTTQTYNLVLYGLANCEPCVENAERAERILQDMIECQQQDVNKCACGPDFNTF